MNYKIDIETVADLGGSGLVLATPKFSGHSGKFFEICKYFYFFSTIVQLLIFPCNPYYEIMRPPLSKMRIRPHTYTRSKSVICRWTPASLLSASSTSCCCCDMALSIQLRRKRKTRRRKETPKRTRRRKT